jgi:hypothetical protein
VKFRFNAMVAVLLVGVGVLALDPRYRHLTHSQKVTAAVAVVAGAVALQAAIWAVAYVVRGRSKTRQATRQTARQPAQPVRGSWQ